MLGFKSDGTLNFGSVNWIRTGNNISYTDGNVSIGTPTATSDKLLVAGNIRVQTGSLVLTD